MKKDKIHKDIIGMFTRYGKVNPDFYKIKIKTDDRRRKTNRGKEASPSEM